MFTVDLEAHYYTQAMFAYLSKQKTFPNFVKQNTSDAFDLNFSQQVSLFQTNEFIEILCDLGAKRIAAMDHAGLDVQVLSFSSPGIDEIDADPASATEFATEMNDILYDAVKKNPRRFLGFAAISPYDVPRGVNELTRAISKLGFVGWLAHANFGKGKYLDDQKYWPLLEAAQHFNIPIYLHPTIPLTSSYGKYGFSLAGPPLGFQFETSLCLMRMIYAGVFDQFPNLNIILGHMGETLPFLMPDRIDWAYINPDISDLAGFIKERPKIKRTPNEVLLSNVYITTSGRFSHPLLEYCLQIMGPERIMLATDYPYEDLTQSMNFIRECKIPESTLNNICHQNAEGLGISLRS